MRSRHRPSFALVLALIASSAAAACGSAGTTVQGSSSGGKGGAASGGKGGASTGKGGDGSGEGGSTGQGEGGEGAAPSTGGSGGAGAGAQGGQGAQGGAGQGAAGGGGPGPGGQGAGGSGAGAGAGGSSGNQSAGGGGGDAGSGQAGAGAWGSSGSGGSNPSGVLTVVPADAVFTPPQGAGLSAAYKAVLKKYGDPDKDVTGSAVFSVDPPTFGQFAGATLKAPAGQLGKGTVKAEFGGLAALTSVTIAQPATVFGPGAGGDSPGKFGGADDPGAKPSIVYPPDGVLVPPNMNSLELHFVPGAGQTLFEIAFTSPTVSLTVYTGCTPLGSGCVYVPDDTFWKQIANAARGGEPVTYAVRGVSGGQPGSVGKSASRSIQFASDDLSGGIYYWNSGGTIQRYDFGLPNKASETYLNAFEAGGFTCVGCHAMSRDGKKMAVGVDIPGSSPYRMFKVANKTLAYTAGQASNFFAFDPTGTKVLTSNGINIALADADSGQVLADPIIAQATMPDWSADGNRVIFARPKSPAFFAVPGVDSASLLTITWNGSAWGQPQTLVPFEGQNNYYPAISPDNGWVVFNRSPANRNSFENASAGDAGAPDGELWGVNASGGSAIRLDAATQAGDSWPKWAPQLGTYAGGPVMWLTVSSWRGYGLRLDPGAKAQLWMVAFDPQRAAAGKDPSFPAFWLPFQDIKSGNHIAQWVTHVDRKPCTTSADCAVTEVCSSPSKGVCLPK